MADKGTVLVVDDETKILEIVKAYLQKEGYAVLTAERGEAALNLSAKANPDLIVLDLMLPDITGEDICRRLRQTSQVPILMLTAKVSEEERVAGLAMGADDYLTKPFSPRELVARVGAILRRARGGLDANKRMSFLEGRLVIDLERYEVTVDEAPVQLTPNEFKLLVTLATYPGRVYSRFELVNRVQGYDFDGYERTMDAHIKNLRQKIEADPKNPEFVLTVYGVGYKFGPGQDD
ncbi:MAG: DNA-binding response regulator [Actinobacteria bacterium]|nr:MAG: DNA-binding response regulator [Actinomycetota bacterium]